MTELSRQEAFDIALAGLRAQGRQSFAADGSGCAYRGQDGCKCAIGFLISDDKYDPTLEGKSASSDFVIRAAGMSVCDGDFLGEMQVCMHDCLDLNLSGLESEAEQFAHEWGLAYTPPSN